MAAQIIDGKAIAAELKRGVREGSDALVARGLRRPGLAVIMVGDNPASAIRRLSAATVCCFFACCPAQPASS